MKTDYFLMVTDWDKHDKGDIAQEWDRVRKAPNVSHKGAEEARVAYEKELNNGKPWSAEARVVEKDKDVRFSVCAIPYNQAREYTSFPMWLCNKE